MLTIQTRVPKKDIMLKGKRKLNLTISEQNTLETFGLEHINTMTIYDKIVLHKKEFTSLKSKDIATVDFFVKLKNGEFGAVRFYLVSNYIIHAFIELYEIVDNTNNLLVVQQSGVNKIFNIRDFEIKMMYMKIGSREVVTQRPNMYEKT